MKIKRRASRAEVPSMAMGDIAFNLLIFFVILAKAQDDSHLHLESAGNSLISIVIDNENDIYLNGQETGQPGLAAMIEEMLAGRPAGDRTVLFKVHREVTAQTFEPVIESISEAGGELVHIVEDKKK
jgi:biopolymer transport protein ExbD